MLLIELKVYFSLLMWIIKCKVHARMFLITGDCFLEKSYFILWRARISVATTCFAVIYRSINELFDKQWYTLLQLCCNLKCGSA